jgi:hypothetical protein
MCRPLPCQTASPSVLQHSWAKCAVQSSTLSLSKVVHLEQQDGEGGAAVPGAGLPAVRQHLQ